MLVPTVVHLLILAAWAEPAPAAFGRMAIFATGDTGSETDTDTDGDTDTDTDTDSDTDSDTVVDTSDTGFCFECNTAAELAGDPGGSPCNSGAAAPVGLLWIPALLLAHRRRNARRS